MVLFGGHTEHPPPRSFAPPLEPLEVEVEDVSGSVGSPLASLSP